jgi:hypothetical protein
MATFLTRAGNLPLVGDLRFRDVGANHVHRAGIGAAAAAGIAHGYSDATFRPMPRSPAGRWPPSSRGPKGVTLRPSSAFADVPSTHPLAGAIGAVARAGIAEGFGEGTFRPDIPITRG